MALVDEYKARTSVANVDSSEEYIQDLNDKYGEIPDELQKDLRHNDDCMFGVAMHTISNPPNNQQAALAQYCMGKLY